MNPKDVKDWRKEWQDVTFTDTIEVREIHRGRSAANFKAFSTTDNIYYTVFISDYLDMSVNGDVNGNKISGVFKVVKKGCNLGIRLLSTPRRKQNVSKFDKHPEEQIPSYI